MDNDVKNYYDYAKHLSDNFACRYLTRTAFSKIEAK